MIINLKQGIKVVILLLGVIIMCMFPITVSFADTRTTNVEIDTNKITTKEMFERAANSTYTETDDSEDFYVKATLKNSAGVEYDVKVFEYVEEKAIGKSNGYVLSLAPQYLSNNTRIGAGNQDVDDFRNVYAYLNIEYDKRAYNSSGTRWQYLLQNVSGSWDIQQSGIQLRNKEVLYACTASFDTDQVVHKYPQSNSFNYSTGFTNYVPEGPICCVQAKSVTDITRGSDTWQLEVEVIIVSNNEFE